HLVERRLRDVEVPILEELGVLPEEEREKERADVRTVDVRIGHDDDPVVAEPIEVLVLVDAAAERGDEGRDLLRAQHLVEARALDVQDLAAERQDRLELAVASLLGGAAGALALDEEELRLARVALLAVSELAGQGRELERALALHHLARLARRLARAR